MRLLLVADLHYSLPQYDWLVSEAPNFDVVAFAGDFLDIASIVDGRAQIVVVRKYLQRIQEQTTLLTCSGNHDLDTSSDAGEKVAGWMRNLEDLQVLSDGSSRVIDDTLFSMCAWWDGPIERTAIGEKLRADAQKRTGRWIWLYHAPPTDSPVSWGGQRSFGDTELNGLIGELKPDMVLSGHVHQSPFITDGSWADRIGKTWIFNAGHQFGAPPAHVIIDTDVQEAVWFSAMGAQSVRLDQPLTRPITSLTALPEWLKAENQTPDHHPA